MTFNREDPRSWPLKQPIIAHDVGRSRDRSTAVVGGNCPAGPRLLWITELEELPLNLVGSARASALATVDRRHGSNALIVADLSNDESYAEQLLETFGPRVIGVHISRYGDGMQAERRPVKNASMLIYNIGRNYLLESFHAELQCGLVKMVDGPMSVRAYEQLANLEVELRDSGTVYACPPGKHDDLGISCAMLAWAAGHAHLGSWMTAMAPRRPRRAPPKFSSQAWT